jgi:hypothetical protein
MHINTRNKIKDKSKDKIIEEIKGKSQTNSNTYTRYPKNVAHLQPLNLYQALGRMLLAVQRHPQVLLAQIFHIHLTVK